MCIVRVQQGGCPPGPDLGALRAGFGQEQPDPTQDRAARTHTTCSAFGALTNTFANLIYAEKKTVDVSEGLRMYCSQQEIRFSF